MPTGIKLLSFVDTSGYAMAALAYVRALVNAGVPVLWVPVRYEGNGLRPVGRRHAPPLSLSATDDESLADLPALVAATCFPNRSAPRGTSRTAPAPISGTSHREVSSSWSLMCGAPVKEGDCVCGAWRRSVGVVRQPTQAKTPANRPITASARNIR